jgi:spore maturation protein SpmA
MNAIFVAMIGSAFAIAVARGTSGVPIMADVTKAIVEDASGAVTLAVGIAGVMTLFLGLMKVAEQAGLLLIVARLLQPLMQRLFPEVPPGHPAMGAMIMNIAANVLGLGNAATPFGMRAMQHLDALNANKGTATNAMVLFLAINTSSVTVLPTSVIALRAAAGSADPAGVMPTTLFATVCSTLVAIASAKTLQRWWATPAAAAPSDAASAHIAAAPTAFAWTEEATRPVVGAGNTGDHGQAPSRTDRSPWATAAALVLLVSLVSPLIFYGRDAAPWIVPGLVVGLLGFGMIRGVRVYEAFVEGGRDGFQIAVRIIPYLVAILVAVGMLRASGALDLLVRPISAITAPIGLPAEALVMAFLRPLSGSGAYGYLASLLNDPAIGPDSYTGYLVSTIQGSTESTFYVLAVYFGAVGVARMRHAVVVGLAADATGVLASAFVCSILHGS